MKAKRCSGRNQSNATSRVSNSIFYCGEKAMCVALDFFVALLYS